MSNKKCPRCGKSYPSSYRSCPYCSEGGRRRRASAPSNPLVEVLRGHGNQIFLGVTGFFLVVAILGMILTKCSAAPAPTPKPDDDVKPPEAEEPLPKTDPLTISNTTLSLTVGESAVLILEGGEETEEAAVWTSSDETVVAVEYGLVTAQAAGSATVTASRGQEQVSCVVTVKEKDPDVEVYLTRTDFTLSAKYPSYQMEVRVRDTKKKYDGGVTWSVEDPSVATVSETGLVERVGKGTTKVTATMGTKTLTCIVRVS
ncbi:MAG: Ig-like domain-containing protein [Oscillospiraceae bacterium]|nr:Ig-like domain-containing protein [Oscillospiraceae bacterium]